MVAFRKIVHPENGTITLELPSDFAPGDVEVIVLPETPTEPSLTNGQKRVKAYGIAKGQIVIHPDFNEPLEDFKDYM